MGHNELQDILRQYYDGVYKLEQLDCLLNDYEIDDILKMIYFIYLMKHWDNKDGSNEKLIDLIIFLKRGNTNVL